MNKTALFIRYQAQFGSHRCSSAEEFKDGPCKQPMAEVERAHYTAPDVPPAEESERREIRPRPAA